MHATSQHRPKKLPRAVKIRRPDVLVLNRAYVPVQIIEWWKAMSHLVQDNARPLDRDLTVYTFKDWLEFSATPADYPSISTVKYKIFVPEIIVLSVYDRLPKCDVKYTRQTVFQRDNYRCAYCGNHFKKDDLTIDHIHPKDLGGKSTWENAITACKPCNARKSNIPLEKCGMKLLFKPRAPRWSLVSKIAAEERRIAATESDPENAGFQKPHICESWKKLLHYTSKE